MIFSLNVAWSGTLSFAVYQLGVDRLLFWKMLWFWSSRLTSIYEEPFALSFYIPLDLTCYSCVYWFSSWTAYEKFSQETQLINAWWLNYLQRIIQYVLLHYALAIVAQFKLHIHLWIHIQILNRTSVRCQRSLYAMWGE